MLLISFILIILMGVIGGALVNYISDVLPLHRRLVKPFCQSCKTPLSWSYYLIGWRSCPVCGKGNRWRVCLVEITYVIIAILLWKLPPVVLGSWLGFIVLVFFGIVVIIDLEHRLILHPVSLFGAGLGLVTGTWLRANYYATHGTSNGFQILGLGTNAWIKGMIASLGGGLAGFLIMWVLYFLGEKLMHGITSRRGLPTNEVALGFGDVNLSGVLGLMLGWPVIIMGIFIAIILGGIISLLYLIISLILRRYHMFTALPYGPYLVAGAVLLLYFSYLVTSFLK